MVLKVIYSLFLGLLLVTFIGVGIAAFYPAPKSPDYPTVLNKPVAGPDYRESPEDQKIREDYDATQKQYQKDLERYSRNVSSIAIGFAIIILILSLILAHSILLISDGLLLGGVFTLIYGIGWGFAAQDNIYRFVVVTIGLVIALFLGYWKFVKQAASPKPKTQ